MPLWIPITVSAALFQCWRTAMQQKLRHLLSVNGAGFVRFLYGAPTAFVLFAGALIISGLPVPIPTRAFLFHCTAGGLMQILATNLLILSFGYRNFTVGTAYSKTETAQSAIIALIVLGEVLAPLCWIGICIGVAGVMTLSLTGGRMRLAELVRATVQPAALAGLGAGFLFALTTVFIKLANQALSGPSLTVRALFVLLVTNTLQTLMQGAFVACREPHELRKTLTTWRSSAWVGALSAMGSACWFTAFALAPIGLVRSVGQVEIVFTLVFGRFYLKETQKAGDVAGLVLVVGGVLLIVIAS
jgi:drug/metabolite transporter (DMT)-like permease